MRLASSAALTRPRAAESTEADTAFALSSLLIANGWFETDFVKALRLFFWSVLRSPHDDIEMSTFISASRATNAITIG
jgi:hypothetical protein